MPGITGQGQTFNLPNYHGELLSISPSDTPFLNAIGGLTGGKRSSGQVEHAWSAYDLRDPSSRTRAEGADAPTAEERTRWQMSNILEIHQESVEVSYTKQAATQQYAGLNIGSPGNAVEDELGWQLTQQIKQTALDVEYSFIRSAYQKPTDNTTHRKTRGLIAAAKEGVTPPGGALKANVIDKGATPITTVAVTAADSLFTKAAHGLNDGDAIQIVGGATGGFSDALTYYVRDKASGTFKVAATVGGPALVPAADVSVSVVKLAAVDGVVLLDLVQLAYDNGGFVDGGATLLLGSSAKRWLTKEFITDAGYQESTRNVGGVNVQTIETDFGVLNVMLSRQIPKHKIVFAALDQCAPVFLETPGRGYFFAEPLAKTGASDKVQLYGEIGLEYGNPLAHGVLEGVVF